VRTTVSQPFWLMPASGGELAAGVVDQAVDGAMVGDDALDDGFDRVFVADVAAVGMGDAAVLFDFIGYGLDFFELAADEDGGGAQGGQFMGRAAANAGPAAGDNDRLVFE